MGGGVLQLVSNQRACQNRWLINDPQITFFKTVYRRHTPFASEMIPVKIKNKVNFGSTQNVDIPVLGDLVHEAYLVFDIPKLAAVFANSKSEDIQKIIHQLQFSDEQLIIKLKSYARDMEYDQILNLIEETLETYQMENNELRNMHDLFKSFKDVNDIKNINGSVFTDILPHQISDRSSVGYEFHQYKTDLMDIYFSQKPKSYLFYDFVKFIYLTEKDSLDKTVLVNSNYVFQAIQDLLPDVDFNEEYLYGDSFNDQLNSYNSIITVLQSLAKTTPVIVAKPFYISSSEYSIYTDDHDVILTKPYGMIVDPTFKHNYFCYTDDCSDLLRKEADRMFSLIQKSLDQLIEKYQDTLFSRSERLLFNNSHPLSNIYSYQVPTQSYQDQFMKRIKNVFNGNIWFFYFFRYLDYFNENSFCDYVNDNICLISHQGKLLLKHIIILLKINLEFYMHEISYLLNDLYASSPSINPSDTLKNYVPLAFNQKINNVDIHHNLFAFTMIFHRNHVPTITELFQTIYYFIDTIDLETINRNLDLTLPETEMKEVAKIKQLIKQFYYQIFKYFMDVYDEMSFEPKADFSLNEYPEKDAVDKYALHFLNGSYQLNKKYQQHSLSNVIHQMEFYFTAEMIGMQAQRRMYRNIFHQLKSVSETSASLVDIILSNLSNLDPVFDLESLKDLSDPLRTYLDRNYQHNILQKKPDLLYYSTFNIDRYHGQSYLNTPYQTRNYGQTTDNIDPPIPIPPTQPYGINPLYYNHKQSADDKTYPVFWINQTEQKNTSHNQSDFLLSEIDFFRIKHEIFYPDTSVVKTFDYQFNLLKLLRLIQKGSIHDSSIPKILESILDHMESSENADRINQAIIYFNENSSIDSSIIELLEQLFIDQKNIIDYQTLLDHQKFIKESLKMKNGLLSKIILLRDNYLMQYYYYSLFYPKINKTVQILKHNEISHLTSNELFNQLIGSKEQISDYALIYPNSYLHQIHLLQDNDLTDFDQFIASQIVSFWNNNKFNKLTSKDVHNIISLTFHSMKTVYSYLMDNQRDDLIEKLKKYQQMLLKNILSETPVVGLKEKIIDDIFSDPSVDPQLKHSFEFIDESYYVYIYYFIRFAQHNNLSVDQIWLPTIIINDANTIDDVFKNMFDFLWKDYSDGINEIHQVYQTKISTKNTTIRNEIDDIRSFHPDNLPKLLQKETSLTMDKLLNKISVLAKQNNYFDHLNEKNEILSHIKKTVQSKINQIEIYQNELIILQNKISTVLYRNQKAKTAWIRKLAHYLVKDITLIHNNCSDCYVSDWMEAHYQISQSTGTESSYLKMIGHRDDLIVYNDQVKNSYTIMLPLIFYFNKDVSLSLPLNASSNTKYQIKVRFRNLDDVAYKEEFSSYVNPELNFQMWTPQLSNVHLMLEYIYLGSEERNIFVKNSLEYLITELQISQTTMLTDNNLKPIYQIETEKKTLYTDNQEANDLIPFKDYDIKTVVDSTGVEKTIVTKKSYTKNPLIHKKRIEIANYFHHPVKFMVTLIKPLRHTDLSYRKANDNYFFGEKQWDNYTLYPYYDLSGIQKVKLSYYYQFKNEISDLEDPNYGFIGIINRLLLDDAVPKTKSDEWIEQNRSYYLEMIQRIKDKYLAYHGNIYYQNNLVHLIEDILGLDIDYPIVDSQIKSILMNDIYHHLGLSADDFVMDFHLDKNELIEKIVSVTGSIEKSVIKESVNKIYRRYNESIVIYLVYFINQFMDLKLFTYHPRNILLHFLNCYQSDPDHNLFIVNITKLALTTLPDVETLISHTTFKDVIYQIMLYQNKSVIEIYDNLITHSTIQIIVEKMNLIRNQIVDQKKVEIVDYQALITQNPKINPLLTGYIRINNEPAMIENSDSNVWNHLEAYKYLKRSPSQGVNFKSWALDPLNTQPSGSFNFSRTNSSETVLDVHPIIDNDNPAEVVTMAENMNIKRYLSGMCGKVWSH